MRLCPTGTSDTDMREFNIWHAARDPEQSQKQTICSDIAFTGFEECSRKKAQFLITKRTSLRYQMQAWLSNLCIYNTVYITQNNQLSEGQIRKTDGRLSGHTEQTLLIHEKGKRKSKTVVWEREKKKKLVVPTMRILPPTLHSPVYSVGGRTLAVFIVNFLLAEYRGLPSIHSVSAMLRLHSR